MGGFYRVPGTHFCLLNWRLSVYCRLSAVACYQFPVSSGSCKLPDGNSQLPVICLPAIKTHCQSIDLYEIGAHVWFANSCHLAIIKLASVAARAQTCIRLRFRLRFCDMHHFTGNLILILFTDHLAKRFLFIFMYLFVLCLCQRVTVFGNTYKVDWKNYSFDFSAAFETLCRKIEIGLQIV